MGSALPLQLPQKIQALMSLFDKAHSVFTPGEGVGEVYTNILNAGDLLHSCAVDVKSRGSGSAGLLEVHYHLFCFVVVESGVVLPAIQSQTIHLLPVC